MSRETDANCRGLIVAKTENAICVQKTTALPRDEQFWIPRSQIGYMRIDKAPADSPHGHDSVTFTLPEWLVEKKQCWDLVE